MPKQRRHSKPCKLRMRLSCSSTWSNMLQRLQRCSVLQSRRWRLCKQSTDGVFGEKKGEQHHATGLTSYNINRELESLQAAHEAAVRDATAAHASQLAQAKAAHHAAMQVTQAAHAKALGCAIEGQQGAADAVRQVPVAVMIVGCW